MIPWPILRRELRAAARRRDAFVARLIMGAFLGLIVGAIGAGSVGGDLFGRSVFPARGIKAFGVATLATVAGVECLILAFLVPSLVGGAIAEERERETLPFLLLTRLTRLEIVAAKLAGRLAPAVSLTLVGVPFVVFAAYLAGLFPEVAALASAGLLSTTLFMGALSVHASARCRQAGNARALATVAVWGWLVIVPPLSFLPVPADPIAGALAWAVRQAAGLVGPSSPLWLALHWGWATATGPSALASEIARMVATQAALGTLAVAAAVGAMKRHEPRRGGAGAGAEARPPCGDDPIFWREHDLPTRASLAWRPAAIARQVVSLARVLAAVLMQLAAILLAAGLPVALALLTLRMAVPAFREHWLGGGDGGAFSAREELAGLIQGVTAFVALLGLLGVTATAAGRVAHEREKGTWLVLLTTPLDGPEILGGKLRATARAQGRAAALLLPLWAVGAACGAIRPAGAALAALDLAAAIALGLAVGLWLGVRPGAPATAMSASALVALGLTIVHVPYLLAVLLPDRALSASADALGPARLAAAVAAALAVPAATALLAVWLTRRVFDRFDAYVGRPSRPGAG